MYAMFKLNDVKHGYKIFFYLKHLELISENVLNSNLLISRLLRVFLKFLFILLRIYKIPLQKLI